MSKDSTINTVSKQEILNACSIQGKWGELATTTTGFHVIAITETWGNNKPKKTRVRDQVTYNMGWTVKETEHLYLCISISNWEALFTVRSANAQRHASPGF